jgi:hypothetical protein
MTCAQLVSSLSRGRPAGRATLLALGVLFLLAATSGSRAQDAGVSGIPLGPGNARGLNGSVNDPSGIGNASKVPPLPQPNLTPVRPPAASPPAVYRSSPVQGAIKIRRTRYASRRLRRAAERAAVSEQDKLIDRKLTSICRGC